MAEGVGFEPTDPCGSPVFKTGALGRYATPPRKSGYIRKLIWSLPFYRYKSLKGWAHCLQGAYAYCIMNVVMQDDHSPFRDDEASRDIKAAAEPAEDWQAEREPNTLGDVDVLGGPPILSWQASEYIHHHKPALWYVGVFGAVAVLLLLGIITKQWSGMVVLVLMTVAVLVYANKQPRVLNYSLTNDGIIIDTKFHPYNQFRSFGVVMDVGWHSIDLDPIKRFMPRLTILLEDHHVDDVIEALSRQLPRHDRGPDVIERWSRKLKF
jgi:hypothetical protein